MRANVKLWRAIGICIIGILFVGCNTNLSATKHHASGKKNKSANIYMDGSYVMPDNTRMFKYEDVFLNFNSKGGKKTVKYNQEACPRFICSTSEDWLVCMKNDIVTYQTAKDTKGMDCFILYPLNEDNLNRFYAGDVVNKQYITPLASQYFHYNGVLGIDLVPICWENKFAMPIGEEKWVRAVFDPDKHLIQLHVQPNNTGKCRVLTLVLNDLYGSSPYSEPFLNNAIRIFQRHD